jgi:hypothetical protein
MVPSAKPFVARCRAVGCRYKNGVGEHAALCALVERGRETDAAIARAVGKERARLRWALMRSATEASEVRRLMEFFEDQETLAAEEQKPDPSTEEVIADLYRQAQTLPAGPERDQVAKKIVSIVSRTPG